MTMGIRLPLGWGRGFYVCAGLCLLISIICTTQEISSRPGYESSLIVSPALCVLCGLAVIFVLGRCRAHGLVPSASALLKKAFSVFLVFISIPAVVLMLSGIIRGFCDFVEGIKFYIIGPVASGLSATVVSFIIAVESRKSRTSVPLWFLVIAISIGVDLVVFYFTPKVDVFDHLLGYFAGPLWDEAIRVDERLLVFRTVSVLRFGLLLVIYFLGWEAGSGKFRMRKLFGSIFGVIFSTIGIIVFIGTFYYEIESGVFPSRRKVEEMLRAVRIDSTTVAYLPWSVSGQELRDVVDDIGFRKYQLEEFFNQTLNREIKIYYFPSASVMKKYTGTGPTSVAKLWLGEIYLLYKRAPHPLLKHELAHLYCAAWGSGPFRLPGRFWGLIQESALLEGTATAAEGDYTPATCHQIASAALRAGVLEDWSPFSFISFFSINRAVAYRASGSFVRYIYDRFGLEALRRWYGGERFSLAIGISKLEAESDWRRFLEAQKVSPRLVMEIKRRYHQPAIFHRTCPHQVSNLYVKLDRVLSEGRTDEAFEIMQRIISKDCENPYHRLNRLRMFVGTCRVENRAMEEVLRNSFLMERSRVELYSLAGDMAWIEGRPARAQAFYSKALEFAWSDYDVRMLEIKRWATGLPDDDSRIFLNYLVCGRAHGSALDRVLALVGIMDMPSSSSIANYLVGRYFFVRGNYRYAIDKLRASLRRWQENKTVPLPLFETLYLICVSLIRLSDFDQARVCIEEAKGVAQLSPSQRRKLQQLEQFYDFKLSRQ